MKMLLLTFAIFMSSNGAAGPGGDLLSNVPDKLTDMATPPGFIFAR